MDEDYGMDDEFGNDLISNQGIEQPFGYTGYQYDNIAQTYFAQAREYDPLAARFYGIDTVKGFFIEPLTQHPYIYCLNNPIRYIDPSGYLAWPGELHQAVQNHIVYGDQYASSVYSDFLNKALISSEQIPSPCGRYLATEIKISYGDDAKEYFGKKSGRADIVDKKTGELWEIKSNQSGFGLLLAKIDIVGYLLPGNKYNSKKVPDINTNQPIRGTTDIPEGTFVYKPSGLLQPTYTVSYSNPEPGVILYVYSSTSPSYEEIAITFVMMLLFGVEGGTQYFQVPVYS